MARQGYSHAEAPEEHPVTAWCDRAFELRALDDVIRNQTGHQVTEQLREAVGDFGCCRVELETTALDDGYVRVFWVRAFGARRPDGTFAKDEREHIGDVGAGEDITDEDSHVWQVLKGNAATFLALHGPQPRIEVHDWVMNARLGYQCYEDWDRLTEHDLAAVAAEVARMVPHAQEVIWGTAPPKLWDRWWAGVRSQDQGASGA